jgi:hypothetical protein
LIFLKLSDGCEIGLKGYIVAFANNKKGEVDD